MKVQNISNYIPVIAAGLMCFSCSVVGARTDDVELLNGLIRIPSVSADVEQVNRIVDFARADFERRGLFCTVETNSVGRRMLWVANVRGRRPDIVFSSHLDVVPAQSPEQFEPREEDGWLYGRGAADSKCHVVLAARVMEDLKGKVSVGAIIGTDEEMGGSTTREMMDRGFGGGKLAVVADVLPYTLTTRHKGLADYVIRIRKEALHQGIRTGPTPNAIVDLMDGYRRLAAKLPEYEDGTWREMFTCMEIGGERDNAFMRLRVRPTDRKDWSRLERWIGECFGGEVTCTRKGDPVCVDENDPLVTAFLAAMRAKWPDRNCRYLHYNSSTDARHVQDLGLPMLLLGVETSDMHARNERVRVEAIDDSAELIESFLLRRFVLSRRP